MNDSNKENRFNHQCSLRMRQCRKRNKSISVPLLPYFCRVAFIYSAIIQTSVKFKALLTCDEMLHFCLVLLRFILIMAGIIHGKISKESNRNNLPPQQQQNVVTNIYPNNITSGKSIEYVYFSPDKLCLFIIIRKTYIQHKNII